MEILDQDMQIVRSWLEEAKAPFHIKSHFENLVDQHAKEADRAATLKERVESLENEQSDELDKMQEERDELQDQLDDLASDGMRGALETVKYWIIDVVTHGRPMQKSPRQILRLVEDAIR